MELSPGYRLTEIGLIPDDWDVIRLGECADFRTGPFGSALHKSDYTKDGVPVVNPMHLIDGRIEPSRTMTITEQAARLLSEFRLRCGDIVIGRRGDMGRCAVAGEQNSGWLCGTGSMIVRPKGTDPRFLQLVIASPRAVAELKESSVGTTMVNLNQSTLARLRIQWPSRSEQRAIADAVNAVTELVERLSSLITKKRDLKQAAMQQLLTGRTRLPGFRGEWRIERLGELARIKTGSRNNEDKVEGGQYPFFVRSEVVERIDSYSHDCEAVLIPGEGRIGSIFHYINGRFDVHQRVYAITRFKPHVSGRFIHAYMIMHFGPWAMQNTVKATVDSLRLPTFQTFEIRMPPTKDEQTAIAIVLSDMDAELAALEARLEKTKALKQAMMQELLTGRTRLIAPEPTHA